MAFSIKSYWIHALLQVIPTYQDDKKNQNLITMQKMSDSISYLISVDKMGNHDFQARIVLT